MTACAVWMCGVSLCLIPSELRAQWMEAGWGFVGSSQSLYQVKVTTARSHWIVTKDKVVIRFPLCGWLKWSQWWMHGHEVEPVESGMSGHACLSREVSPKSQEEPSLSSFSFWYFTEWIIYSMYSSYNRNVIERHILSPKISWSWKDLRASCHHDVPSTAKYFSACFLQTRKTLSWTNKKSPKQISHHYSPTLSPTDPTQL